MDDKKTILVVEDSKRLRDYICSSLESPQYRIIQAGSGKQAYEMLKQEFIDLVLLDLNLGDIDGLEILKTIRGQNESLPVIVVSSITSNTTKVEGFNIGCDDYITKPFYVEELISRVRRILKRSEQTSMQKTTVADVIVCPPFELNVLSFTLKKNNEALPVRKKLFSLMLYFVRNPNAALSNQTLFEHAWDSPEFVNENSLYVHIRQLRSLIEDDPANPRYIQTVRNVGYMFVPDPENTTL